jgi:HSP20 family protein
MFELTRWAPFRSVFDLHREIDGLFSRFFGEGAAPSPGAWSEGPAWWPAVETYTRDGNLYVRVALPGVVPKDVEVAVTHDLLTIKGERKASQEVREGNYLHREFAYGAFERHVNLPDGVDAAKVQAKYTNGMLEISMPAPLSVAPRKIEVQVTGASEPKAIKAA